MCAQTQAAPELANILERLDRLEHENRALTEQVRALQAQSGNSRCPPQSDRWRSRLDIQEQRIEEQAQTKVEASQKFPIRLTGMALFNAFLNSQAERRRRLSHRGRGHRRRARGATLRQTILGLEFRGPRPSGAARSTARSTWISLLPAPLTPDHAPAHRLHRDRLERPQPHGGVEKPIFNPREPSSLAQVGVSPLTGAGNLWLWLPQVRVEQDFSFGAATGLRAAGGRRRDPRSRPVRRHR